jgi:hypothetical protein
MYSDVTYTAEAEQLRRLVDEQAAVRGVATIVSEGAPPSELFAAVLQEAPAITVPAITLEGDANDAPHPDPSAGHNLPQEAPEAFADAVLEVGGAT